MSINLIMELPSKDKGKIMLGMVLEYKIGLMEQFMKDFGLITKLVAEVSFTIRTAR